METLNLEVQTRNMEVKARDLLRSNMIPAQFYGKGVENKSIQMDYQTFRRVFRKAGSHTLIEMSVDGKEKLNVIVHDVQYNPVTDEIKHVDFLNVRMDQKLKIKVPLEFVGEAPAIKELGGILTPNLHEVEVECLPKDLIHSIEVSIEALVDFNSSIKVADLKVPATVTILTPEDEMVVNCAEPREEEAADAPVGSALPPEEEQAQAAEAEAAKAAENKKD